MSKKTVTMKFNLTVFYNDQNVPAYTAGEIAEVEPHMVTRWLKRGAEIVEVPPATPIPAKADEAKVEEECPTHEDTIEPTEEKAEDKVEEKAQGNKNKGRGNSRK